MKRVVLLATGIAMFCAAPLPAAIDTLIPFGATWKYLDDGSDQGTNWKEPSFNDNSWAEGAAELGYGDGDEATQVDFGGLEFDKHITTYFRHHFNVPNPSIYAVLLINIVRDDGAVVYLNGTEIFRDNMPGGNFDYQTFASGSAPGDGKPPVQRLVPLGVMQAGENVLAIEIHQHEPSSSDLSFDLEFLANTENSNPSVSILSPGENGFFTAPANINISAGASDSDGFVELVEFYANGEKLGEDTSSPYDFEWTGVGVGNYALQAVATDNLGAMASSAEVNIMVGVSTPPVVQSVFPPPGALAELTQVAVTFSEGVFGVDAEDLLINGRQAVSVDGSGSTYVFNVPPVSTGPVLVSWRGSHGIVDFESPPRPFNAFAASASWQYQLNDSTAPVVVGLEPPAGAALRELPPVRVTFSEAVQGVHATDLRLNGVPALSVEGHGAGPYEFEFGAVDNGALNLSWVGGHGITDQSPAANIFAGGSWSYNLDTNRVFEGNIVINEIMYHPSSELVEDEWIELYNRGPNAVNLEGWRLNRGVDYVFPDVTLPAGGYLVVAANVTFFQGNHPGVSPVVGGWEGRLSNAQDEIELEDASGDRVDLVHYADEGDYADRISGEGGWVWFSEADGFGSSLELRNPALDNNRGQNWLASAAAGGTPGQANDAATANVPPMILDVGHFPAIPRSTNSVTITATVEDENPSGASMTLYYRNITGGVPEFSEMPMTDDGASNDGVAGDGVYGAVLPPRPDGSIFEFYVEAEDSSGQTRVWPESPGQEAVALFQYDDEFYDGDQTLCRLVMRPADRNDLFGSRDRVPRNVTLISREGEDVEIRYLCDMRRRGASSFGSTPPTLKFNIPRDNLWNGKSSYNLNSVNTYAQVIGSVISLKAGLPAAAARAVQVRFNGVNESSSGAQMYGAYALVEPLNGEWAERQFPNDSNGNVYSKRRPECFLEYRGTDPQAYMSCAYDKESNASENDWSDLASLMFALDPDTTPDNEYLQAVRQNINVEMWLRYFAVSTLMNYAETALCNGADDDYNHYRGIEDPRFLIIPHDFDTIFGVSGSIPNDFFLADRIPNISRFMHHPQIEPLYFEEYRRLLNGVFSTEQLFPLMDQFLGSWVPSGTLDSMKNNAANRINYAASQVLGGGSSVLAQVRGAPESPTGQNTAVLTVGGEGITHYRYRLNDGAYSAERSVSQTISLSGLADGTYTVSVIGRDVQGVWQSEEEATISETWVVLSQLRGVRFNELLASNQAAVNHEGTFPDMVELYNSSSSTVDLAGMRVTDDLQEPNKFVFPAGVTLPGGGYLVLYANEPDGTSGIHLGFALAQGGETLFLLDRPSLGGRVVDTREFGLQLADRSVGRMPNGQWGLCVPTFGGSNLPVATGNQALLRINEWLAFPAAPFVEDFVEIYNPGNSPVSLGGLYMTDNPYGDPFRHRLAPLTFLDAFSYLALKANGGNDPDELSFGLSQERGEIALLQPDGAVIDCIAYGQQFSGVSEGRSPNGADRFVFLEFPTPGAGNPTAPMPEEPVTVNLIGLADEWRYDESGDDLGTEWKEPGYNDNGWDSGPGLLAVEDCGCLPVEPIGTGLNFFDPRQITYYFRREFDLPSGLDFSSVQFQHVVDDGAIFYVNGTEVGRYNMPSGSVDYLTTASGAVGNAALSGALEVPVALLNEGNNLIAVEVHQVNSGSSDIVFGLNLEAVIITNNPATSGIAINEVMVNNVGFTNADGTVTDWVELYNPSNRSIDLAGMSLTDDLSDVRRWVFPAGITVGARAYRVIRFDPDRPASTNDTGVLNAGFGLAASGDAVYLFNRPSGGGELLDALTFGLQAPDLSVGRVPDGTENWVLNNPTMGAVNIASTLGDARQLKINEWMADPESGDDWFEIYNPNAQPVDLSGLWLTDNLNDRLTYQIPPLSFIGTVLRGFREFVADDNPAAGADHVTFRLSADGESIGISSVQGDLIDGVTFGAQVEGVAQGRLPDGSAVIVSFPGTATPGDSNFIPIGDVVINEVLTHSDLPLEDAIELHNPSGSAVDIGGWYLSDDARVLKKYRIPDGTVIPANGYRVLYEFQFNANPDGLTNFALSSSRGDELHLAVADGSGNLTGFRAAVEFGPAENGVSFGRYVTSAANGNRPEFVPMARRTFGVDNPSSVGDFRDGQGLPNALPKVGPVVISEIMYHPPDYPGGEDNVVGEYIELQNTSAGTVLLYDPSFPTNTWRLRDAVDFDFPPGTTIPAGGFLVVVSFDPATDTAALNEFRAAYGVPVGAAIYGPYDGKLDNSSERVELYKPDRPQMAPSPDAGLVPYVLVEEVQYMDLAPWPVSPDGLGQSLHRANPMTFGNDPVNWLAASPSPVPGAGPVDQDGDGMPDDFENLYGFDPEDPSDAMEDEDGDGATNVEEYWAGTNPTDPESVLSVELGLPGNGTVQVQFRAEANRSYTVQYQDLLAPGSTWNTLESVAPSGTPRILTITDPSVVGSRFYRVRTP